MLEARKPKSRPARVEPAAASWPVAKMKRAAPKRRRPQSYSGLRLALVARELRTADHHVVHLVRTVGDPERALAGVHARERRPLRNAGGAVHLDRLIDDL